MSKVQGTKQINLEVDNASGAGIAMAQNSVTPTEVLVLSGASGEGSAGIRAKLKFGLSGAGGTRGYISIETRNSAGAFVEAFRIDDTQLVTLKKGGLAIDYPVVGASVVSHENSNPNSVALTDTCQHQFNFGGVGAAYIQCSKDADFTVAGNRSASISLWVRIANTYAECLRASSIYGTQLIRRLNMGKSADIASAGDMTVGQGGNLFVITGTNTINRITTTGWQAGAEITLHLSSTAAVAHQGAATAGALARINLSGSANYTGAANRRIKLYYDGTDWWEIARTTP